MSKNVVIIGAGINGLVAANYLQRNGFSVTLLERKAVVGGACSVASVIWRKKRYSYPNGANDLGFMQDFIFKETGLKQRLSVYAPKHPDIVYFEPEGTPAFIYDNVRALKRELETKWNEKGDVIQFLTDLKKVRSFLIRGYRKASVPTLKEAVAKLGNKTVNLWIRGSARNLVGHYFTSEKTKVWGSSDVIESGPTSFDAPYSAFTVPLMSSGSVFGGKWGFVKKGIWTLTRTLGEINQKLGVRTVTSAKVSRVSENDLSVTYRRNGGNSTMKADYIIFATDPLSAAKMTGNIKLIRKISKKDFLGSSGKLLLLFRKPVIWKDETGNEDFNMAFRYMFSRSTLDQLERASRIVKLKKEDFVPGFFEISSLGVAMRKLGVKNFPEMINVFFKNLAFTKKGADAPNVKKQIERIILSKIKNKGDFVKSILITPRDIQRAFYYPQGNIYHVEHSRGQTFFDRNYSSDPERNFYQFGGNKNILYCAAGSYPSGSVAGTSGYMCARQLIRRVRRDGELISQ